MDILNAIFYLFAAYIVFVFVAESLNPFTTQIRHLNRYQRKRLLTRRRFALCCMLCTFVVGIYLWGTHQYVLYNGLSINFNLLIKFAGASALLALPFLCHFILRRFNLKGQSTHKSRSTSHKVGNRPRQSVEHSLNNAKN